MTVHSHLTLDVAEAVERGDAAPAPVGAWARRLTVRQEDRVRFVMVDEVDWIESSEGRTLVHCGAETFVIRLTLGRLETVLDPVVFARIHRAVIVNLSRVAEVQPWFGGDAIAILRDGRKLRVSRTHRESLLRPVR